MKYPWGDEIQRFKAKYGNDSERKHVPVGSYSANAFGVHDTASNILEYVEDCWHKNYKEAPIDGNAWLGAREVNCKKRVLWGGFWRRRPGSLPYASRGKPKFLAVTGLRIARTLSQLRRKTSVRL